MMNGFGGDGAKTQLPPYEVQRWPPSQVREIGSELLTCPIGLPLSQSIKHGKLTHPPAPMHRYLYIVRAGKLVPEVTQTFPRAVDPAGQVVHAGIGDGLGVGAGARQYAPV